MPLPTYLDFDLDLGSQKLRTAVNEPTPDSIVATGPDGLIPEELIPPGTDGADGNTVRSGAGAPDDGLGVDGDFYISTAEIIYGPKTGGHWPSGTALTGSSGATGATGATGAAGAPGADGADGADGSTWHSGSGAPGGGTGVNGDYYFRTDTGQVYLKSAGSWGAIANLTGATGATGSTGATGAAGADGADGEGLPTGGTTGQIPHKASNADFDVAWFTIAKADVGLGSVDNTSDAGKPVSTAQQTELDLKINTSVLDTDGTLAANSDAKIATQKAVKTYADTKQAALGFTAENVANKDTDGTLAANSDTKYASQKAVKTYADTKQAALGFTAEDVANKDTDTTLAANSDTKYPSQKAVKSYIDNAITGLKWKASALCASTADLTLVGEQTIDGVATSASRVLVKDQTLGATNGIYVTGAGAWTRASDADSASELVEATLFVQEGTVNGDTQWTCTNNTITLGSTSVAFAQVAGAGTYSAGTGLSLTGNQFAVSDIELLALAGLTSAADKVPYFTGSGTAAVADFSSFGRSLVDDADAEAARATLGLVIGTHVQAFDADLATWAGLTPSANAQSLVTAADYSAMRTLLGLVIGTSVQAYDADLTTWAGLTPSAFFQTLVDDADAATFRTTIGLGSSAIVDAVSTATASKIALRDANKNFAVNRVSQAVEARAGGTTYTLTVASPPTQIVTGNSATTYIMPDATTLNAGDDYAILNMGTGTITVQDSTTGTISTIGAGGSRRYVLRDNSGAPGTWDYTQDIANAGALSNGTILAARMPALTGDVTSSAGAVATTLANIPTAVPMAGSLLATAIAAPGTPASGKGSIYVDSTSKNVCVKDDAGVVKHGVQTAAAVSNQFLTAINDAGACTLAQPAHTNLSDYTAPVAVSFTAGDFTSSAGSWTVGSGDMTDFSYAICGKVMTVWFQLDTTSTSSAGRYLQILIPGGKTAARNAHNTGLYNNNATWLPAHIKVLAADTKIYIEKGVIDGSSFANSTDTTYVYGSITFAIQ